ncbi:expressed unknown protein [Seminavis robusta]|uniref:MHD domain-containing protein n=1 Tax=Seminavis robusta TaxID=568900 RepID=A0A9N8H7V0_9STRA|nr:expressed unknown protein [Seminavis robusta]|eukprot:Sro216_g089240.1 n/a (403) ;mRNA; r:12413-13904
MKPLKPPTPTSSMTAAAKKKQQQQQQQHRNYIETFDVWTEEKQESDPWSATSWTTSTPTSQLSLDLMMFPDVDTSFDSLQFSAESPPEFGYNPFSKNGSKPAMVMAPKPELFPSDPMATLGGLSSSLNKTSIMTNTTTTTTTDKDATVRVSIREEFSTIYDDAGSTPSCCLEGSIYVQPLSISFDTQKQFSLVVKDSHGYVENLQSVQTVSTNISTPAHREGGETVFRVKLPKQSSAVEVPVASYTCNPQLRPIPMLVKSRVQVTDDVSRVGFKVRANPSNTEPLNQMVILVAVPPFVQGETVKMSRKGGIWDEMKRTICWTIDKLEPGEVLEIQAQFQSGNLQNLAQVDLQFPVLVRADVPRLFSGIGIATRYDDEAGAEKKEEPIQHALSQCTRILHRKV